MIPASFCRKPQKISKKWRFIVVANTFGIDCRIVNGNSYKCWSNLGRFFAISWCFKYSLIVSWLCRNKNCRNWQLIQVRKLANTGIRFFVFSQALVESLSFLYEFMIAVNDFCFVEKTSKLFDNHLLFFDYF